MVGATGFEPATSWTQTTRSSQAELRSDARTEISTHSTGSAMRFHRNDWAQGSAAVLQLMGNYQSDRFQYSMTPLLHHPIFSRLSGWTAPTAMLHCFRDRKSTRLNSSHL